MRQGFRLGRIAGIEVRADASLLVLAAIITYDLWLYFSDRFRFPGLGSGRAFAVAFLTTFLFVSSILAHELAHAVMFRARGIPVRGIMLYLFGGLTQGSSEARRPLDEFLITVVGPATTAALGGVFLLLHAQADARAIRSMFGYLAFLNLLMAGFNILPGFPLDGGRLLLSGLWRATGSKARATKIAARVGQGIALLIIVAGLAITLMNGDLSGVWPAIIGLFLFRAATSAATDGDRRAVLESAKARDVMSAPPPTVPPDLPVGRATEIFLEGHDGEAFPVIEDGHILGFISLRTARGVPPERPVRDAVAPGGLVVEASSSDRMDAVAEQLATRGVETVLVLDEGRLVGVIEPEDMGRFFRRSRRSGRRRANPA